jgi:hypothetical protein
VPFRPPVAARGPHALAPSDGTQALFSAPVPSVGSIVTGSTVTGECLGQVPFLAHVELLQLFLAHRDPIVERIQGVLSAQRRPLQYLQDGPLLSRDFEDCFFTIPAVTRDHLRLRGQLEEARRASGFRPRQMPGMHNDLIDPAEMMIRGFHLWRQTRWPGRNGRVRYAQTLFNSYVLRCLELLSMHLWDAGPSGAGNRLSQLQGVLDYLWRTTPADQPALVRDARWLIPLTQSPTTDDLAPYFEVAARITESFSKDDRIEIHKACVQTSGGHLRSQLRHYCTTKGVSLDEDSLVLSSRNSNALDFAILIQGLVPLLEAYEHARHGGDRQRSLELAGAICQGISPDPELFVNRVDLLVAYSMIEHLFIETDREGRAVYTAMGLRHIRLLQEYEAQISRLSRPLYEDCPSFRPVDGVYSPYGAIFGFTSNLTEHMAFKALQPDALTRFSLEDVFADRDSSTEKLAWVSGWRKLPHVDHEVQRLFDYPQQFAEDIFDRIEHALRVRDADADAEARAGIRTGRLFVLSGDDRRADSKTSLIPDLPVRYIGSSDEQIVTAQKAHRCDQTRLLRDRQEGMFVVSYQTPGGWVAITKDILTEVLGEGSDAKLTELPGTAIGVLTLMCPNLVIRPENIGSWTSLASCE